MRAKRMLTALATAIVLLLTALVGSPLTQAQARQAGADLAGRWAPAAKAKIHPGVQMFTKGSQCTANFVFSDRIGRVYVGYSAHCAGKGEPTDTNGCQTPSYPIGTRVRFARGATLATNGTTVGGGTLAYSSWIKMRQRGMKRGPACAANDFALVRVDRDDRRKVNPSVPFWGGPTGLATKAGAPQGTQVYSYGQSSLRPTTALSPKTGTSLGRTDRGWGWDVYTATPGVFGDSGSGFLNRHGRAFGTLSTVKAAPPAANGLGDLEHELRFAQRYSGIRGLHLVRGTVKFSPAP